ncbi:methyl-accepting chemotaxis protein [Elstera cyanobacteriorum]|uniref:Methyl-accepting chemotaxis protein n=1 Tax=Elstera cyanobacteriorum TaxID=2022747 RepID=A0A255XPJ5_9PROT|nr:methyl-accepting chemotaxis protein [Elstera cyanobacteriorum]OYQ18180.1 hypothetical protein CHR90_14605 [Elstera cyanobacteriorum]GFZ83184.1 methyl-accepting chemotaxis protein [Elstera cyanobacteriorum]
MFRTSTSALLVAVQSVMLTGLILAAGTLAFQAWQKYDLAVEIEESAKLNRALLDGMLAVRAQISLGQTALTADSGPTTRLDPARAAASSAYTAALEAFRTVDLPSKTALLTRLDQSWEAQKRAWPLVTDQFSKPAAQRSLAAADPLWNSVRETVSALEQAGTAVGNRVRAQDPALAEMLRVRDAAWQMRDTYGSQCSLLRANIVQNKPLTPETAARWQQGKGSYGANQALLTEYAARSDVPRALATQIATATRAVSEAQPKMDAFVAGIDGNGPGKVDAETYRDVCNGPFDAIVRVATLALDESVTAAAEQQRGALFGLVPAVTGLVLAIIVSVIGFLAITHRLRQPLQQLMGAIGLLSQRDYQTPVPTLARRDELGRMADALEALRQSAQEAERLAAENTARQEAEMTRARAIHTMSQTFESQAAAALDRILQASDRLGLTSASMRTVASDTSTQAGLVASAAEETSASIQTVAAATEELSTSIAEISQQVTQSADLARTAASRAETTNETVEALSDGAQKIGDVVKLISAIAAQTNLLALNATIEAARAGDAGKGFAVVAAEVKNLASQTARATDEISSQVMHIQATTEDAVGAIRSITQMIGRISEGTSAIAAAVEEQGAATREISSNVQRVAQGTAEVTATIADLAHASGQTGAASQQVETAVETVAKEQDGLRHAVEVYLKGVQAA